MKTLLASLIVSLGIIGSASAETTRCHTDVFGNYVCSHSGGGTTRCHTDVFGNLGLRDQGDSHSSYTSRRHLPTHKILTKCPASLKPKS